MIEIPRWAWDKLRSIMFEYDTSQYLRGHQMAGHYGLWCFYCGADTYPDDPHACNPY